MSANTRFEFYRLLANRSPLNLPVSPGPEFLGTVADTQVRCEAFTQRERGGLAKIEITTTAAKTITLGAVGDRAGGVKLLDFGLMGIVPIMGRFRGDVSLSAGTATLANLVFGLGTVDATGDDNAVLTGTSTFIDLSGQRPGAAITPAGSTVAQDVMFGSPGTGQPVDGRAAAADLFLNAAGDVVTATTNLVIASGAVVELFFAGMAPS